MQIVFIVLIWGLNFSGIIASYQYLFLKLSLPDETIALSNFKPKAIWDRFVALSISAKCICVLFSSFDAFLVGYLIPSGSLVGLLLYGLVLITVSSAVIIDIPLHIIPNAIPGFLFIARLIVFLEETIRVKGFFFNYAPSVLFGLVFCFLFLFLCSKLTGGGVGMGDVKLFSAVGFSVGFLCSFYIISGAVISAGVYAIYLLILKKKKLKDRIAFAPFLYIGTIMADLYIGMSYWMGLFYG